MSDFETIAEVWRNNNYPGVDRLTKLVKEKHPTKYIRKAQIVQFLTEQTASQTFKEKRKSKPNGHIVANLVNELWQMDIFDLSRYEKRNDGFRYLLVCIDVFSRKAYVKAMKNKDTSTVINTFTHFLTHKTGPNIRSIIADQDPAWTNDTWLNFMEKENIAFNTNALKDHRALGIIDNFAKRIKLTLNKRFVDTNSTKWTDYIEKVITTYNNQEHRSLGETTPNKVVKDTKIQEKIQTINDEKAQKNTTKSSFSVGDKVKKNMLINESYPKGTDPKWSEKIFEVTEVKGQRIRLNDRTYYLDDHLLKVPETATDAETNVINKLKADQRKEHKSKPVLEKKTVKVQPNPVDEHLREMARQADEEAQKIIKRQQASFAFFESRKRKK
jgi:hypothetical protein